MRNNHKFSLEILYLIEDRGDKSLESQFEIEPQTTSSHSSEESL